MDAIGRLPMNTLNAPGSKGAGASATEALASKDEGPDGRTRSSGGAPTKRLCGTPALDIGAATTSCSPAPGSVDRSAMDPAQGVTSAPSAMRARFAPLATHAAALL